MAKEFLQKHFIKDVKGSLYRGKGSTAARLQNKTFTENGIFKADEGYDGFGEVGVDVPAPNIQPITVTENGTYAAPDGVDGYSPISVEIASAGGTDERFKQLIEGTITEVSDDTVTKVGSYVLYSSANLASVEFPLVTSIGTYAFGSCYNLASVEFPLVTSIGKNAFHYCRKLASVDFPLLTRIGMFAFNDCSELTSVILRSETLCTLSDPDCFKNTPFASGKKGGTLLVPSALVESYKTATNWSTYWGYGHNRFLALEDYTVDGTITGEIDWDKLNNTQGG